MSGLIHLRFSHLQNGFYNILPKGLETGVLLALSGGHRVVLSKLASSRMAFWYLWVPAYLLEASSDRGWGTETSRPGPRRGGAVGPPSCLCGAHVCL